VTTAATNPTVSELSLDKNYTSHGVRFTISFLIAVGAQAKPSYASKTLVTQSYPNEPVTEPFTTQEPTQEL